MKIIRSMLQGVILFTLSLAICFALVEILFRCFSAKSTILPSKDQVRTWYFPEKNIGRHQLIYSEQKPEGVFRVAVVGDSFSFAGKMQYGDGFVERLGRLLNYNNGVKAEVLNLGRPGMSTYDEVAIVDLAIRKFHPDLLILQITLNDPRRETYRPTHWFQDKYGRVKLDGKLFNRSHFLNWIFTRYSSSILQREFRQYYRNIYENNSHWPEFVDSLRRISELASQHKIKLASVIFPLFEEPLNRSYPFRDYHKKIEVELKALDLPYLDLFKFYKNIDHLRLQAMPGIDAHPSEIAHRIAADSLYRWLIKDRFLPPQFSIRNQSTERNWLVNH